MKGMQVLKFDFDPEVFHNLIHENLQKSLQVNSISGHGKLKIQVYREGQGGYAPISNAPSFLIEGYSFKEDLFHSPHTISLASYREIQLENNPLAAYSHLNSLPYVLASIYAKEQGCDEGLMYHGEWVGSTTFGNLFYVYQQKLFTPPLTMGIQQGVVRDQIISLAEKLKVSCEQKRFKKKSLNQADEIFVTHPIRGIVPVHRIDNLTLNPQQFAMTSFFRNCLRQYIQEFFQ